jgi:hypothetical protein
MNDEYHNYVIINKPLIRLIYTDSKSIKISVNQPNQPNQRYQRLSFFIETKNYLV